MADRGSSEAGPSGSQNTETTPLLASENREHRAETRDSVEAQETVPGLLTDHSGLARSMVKASWVLFTVSSGLLVIELVLLFLYTFRPPGLHMMYALLDCWAGICITTFLAIFLSLVNLTRLRQESKTGIIFNMFCHLIIGYFAIVISGSATGVPQYAWPSCDEKADACVPYLQAFVCFIYIAIIWAVILGWIIHPTMLIFWFIKARQTMGGPDRRSFTIPAGRLSFEFSIQFLRQEDASVRAEGNERPVSQPSA